MNVQAMKRNMKNEKGLTLIELLAVIVILGIIAAIAIPAIGNIIQKSKVDAVKSEAIQVLNAAKLYVSSNGIPDGDSLTLEISEEGNKNLDPFIDELKYYGYVVTVQGNTGGKVEYTIAATDVPAGKANITFNNATIKQINDDKQYKEASITIPKS